MRGLAHPGKKAAGSVFQPPDSKASKDSSPMLQALTLSTSCTNTGKVQSKLDVGNTSRDGDQSFTSRTMRHIKAAHQLTSSSGAQSARQLGAVQGKTPLTSPGSLRNRLRDASSDTRKLDVGLRVSAVKVTQRQPMELSQGANGDSPYSAKQADGKGTMKRKGVVKSATFSAGSSEAMDTAHPGDERTARSSIRGVRPNTAPAASENYHLTSSESTKQPPKRRQLTEAPEVPFALPSFRPSTCSTANSPLLRSRQVLRPGTPNPKADAAMASLRPSTMPAQPSANVRVPTSATSLSKHADASKHDWALSKLAAGKAPDAHALRPVRNVRAFQRLETDQQSEETCSSCSSSESSSIAASYEDAAHNVLRQHTDSGQEAIMVRSRLLRRQSSPNLLRKVSSNVLGTSQDIGLGGQGVSSGALSNALKGLNSARQTRHSQDALLVLSQQHQRAATHMNGNTVTSCVSAHQDAAADSLDAEAAINDRVVHSLPDRLMGECAELMHLLGMDDDWFEHEFLPYANKTILHALHTD